MAQRPLSGPESRQGRLGRPVLIVLAVSLILVTLYVIGLMIWVGTGSVGTKTSEPRRQPVGGPDSIVNDGGIRKQ